jgi:hypothetical protein
VRADWSTLDEKVRRARPPVTQHRTLFQPSNAHKDSTDDQEPFADRVLLFASLPSPERSLLAPHLCYEAQPLIVTDIYLHSSATTPGRHPRISTRAVRAEPAGSHVLCIACCWTLYVVQKARFLLSWALPHRNTTATCACISHVAQKRAARGKHGAPLKQRGNVAGAYTYSSAPPDEGTEPRGRGNGRATQSVESIAQFQECECHSNFAEQQPRHLTCRRLVRNLSLIRRLVTSPRRRAIWDSLSTGSRNTCLAFILGYGGKCASEWPNLPVCRRPCSTSSSSRVPVGTLTSTATAGPRQHRYGVGRLQARRYAMRAVCT